MSNELEIKIKDLIPAVELKDSAEYPISQEGITYKVNHAQIEGKIVNKLGDRFVPMAKKGASNGVAPLDENKKIPNENFNFGEVKEGDENVVSGGEVFETIKNYSSGIKIIDLSTETPHKDGIFQPVEVGVYPNFGNLELTQEEKESSIVYFYLINGVFSKEIKSVSTIDEVEKDNTNAVSSRGVYDWSIRNVSNIEKLRGVEGKEGQIITLLGYYEAGDKEPLNYIYNSEQGEDDGGAVINTTNGSWIAVFGDTINIKDFGAKLNGLDSDSESFQASIIFAKNYKYKTISFPSNSTALLSEGIILESNLTFNLNGSEIKAVSYSDVGIYTTTVFTALGKENITFNDGVVNANCSDTGYVNTTDNSKVRNLIYFKNTKNINFNSITFTNFLSNVNTDRPEFFKSGLWALGLFDQCENVNFEDCKLLKSAIEGLFFWKCKEVKILKTFTENIRMSTPLSFFFCDGVKLLNSIVLEDVGRGSNAGSTLNIYSKNVTIDGNYISGGTSIDIGCEIEMDENYVQENLTISNNYIKGCINSIRDEKPYHKSLNVNIFSNTIDASDDYGSPYNYGVRLGNAIDSSIYNNTIIGADNAIRNFGDDWENVSIYENTLKDIHVGIFISVFLNKIEKLNIYNNFSKNKGVVNSSGYSDSFVVFNNSKYTLGDEQVNGVFIKNNTVYSSTSWFFNRNAGFTTFFINNLDISGNNFNDLNNTGCFRSLTVTYCKNVKIYNNKLTNIGINGNRISLSENVSITDNETLFYHSLPLFSVFRLFNTNTGHFSFLRNKSNSSYPILTGETDVNFSETDIRQNYPENYVGVKRSDKGTTADRPTYNLTTGRSYFDTTLNLPVFWNGTEWINYT